MSNYIRIYGVGATCVAILIVVTQRRAGNAGALDLVGRRAFVAAAVAVVTALVLALALEAAVAVVTALAALVLTLAALVPAPGAGTLAVLR
ncbi:MAG: hypothetical protein M3R04_02620 [bacterium]|nr:hypothetical protein [bacterium]